MKNLRKKLLLTYYLPLLLLVIISVIYAVITHLSVTGEKEIIFCIFKEKFHLYCPGCGGSRSLLFLLTFDPVRSFIYFPALPVTVIILIDLYARVTLSFIKNDEKYIKGFRLNLLIAIPVALILNFFVRNALLISGVDLLGDFYR